MRVPSRAIATLLALLSVGFIPHRSAAYEGLPRYSEDADILATTPSTDDGAIGAMLNPAQWGVLEKPELSFFWSDQNVRTNHMDNWGLSMGQGMGFSLRRHDAYGPSGPIDVTDYQIGFGGGSSDHYGGFAFGFAGEGKGAFGRESYISCGDIARPTRWLSTGTVGRAAFQGGDADVSVDIGIRPLGDPRLTLFGDYSLQRGQRLDDGPVTGGIEVRPIPGLQAALRYGNDDRFQLTFGVTLQRSGFRATPHYDDNGHLGATSYAIRMNPAVRGVDFDARRNHARRFMSMDLKGQVTYQGYRYWDTSSLPLRSLTERIQFATDDPTVGGVVLNLSGIQGNIAMMWELREKLRALQARGKKVVVYADNLSAGEYYLASIADRIVMDPRGYVIFPGVQASRTYMKGLLEKLGLGFDEWRYYKYKSAMETFSRENMSDADREQFQAMVDAAYEELASGIVATGRMTRAQFDKTVNEEPFLSAQRLLDLKWIDRVGRQAEVKEEVLRVTGRRTPTHSYPVLAAHRWMPDETWGPKPTIALVYQIGPCAMDEGIKARESSKAIRKLRENSDVKAVVMRADSPGGDPLASDLVADELRALKRAKKPILVSQGRVAGSGGYWISMDADTLMATPFTVTASIGVIGGWVWDKGFGKKTGFSADHVQVGKSADLMGGLRLPILGVAIPERNLDDAERKMIQTRFGELYDDFTQKVATARRLPVERVRELAQGRIYLGRPGVENKLIDRIATLDETIEAAKRAAGIRPGQKVRIVEYPKPGLFRIPSMFEGVAAPVAGRIGSALGPDAGAAPTVLGYEARVLQQMLDAPGRPLLLTPGEVLPMETETVH
ncbi:MAG: S49 family peptidase [Candidatus Eiseniibacteriota bacterium]